MAVETVDTPEAKNLVISFSTFISAFYTEFSPSEMGLSEPSLSEVYVPTGPIYPQGVENFSRPEKKAWKRVKNRWKSGENAVKNAVYSWKT